ncbi:MAG: type II toxin-antitoxin system VapC family toxin [Reyranellaceae bacterium]
MKLLLDSNAFIWAYARPGELSTAARRALGDPANDRLISMASIWEIAIKMSNGKLVLTDDLASALDVVVVSPLPISLAHIDRMRTLPYHHRDPFDRLIIAQAMEEGLTIVTRDRRFPAYGVPLLMA